MWQQPVNRKLRAATSIWPWPAFPVGVFVFLVASFLYVWLRVEPLLEYHRYGPYFYRDRAFMETFVGRPGGLVNYAGVFLSQLNCHSGLGALVFVLSECLVFAATLFCLARVSGRAPGFVYLVPLFVLLLLRNRYGGSVPAVTLGLLLALAAFAAYAVLRWRHPWFSAAVSGLMSGVLFLVAGLWSALLFAVLCSLVLFIQMRHWPAALGGLALALAGPLVAVGAGQLEIARMVNPWPEGVNWVLALALYAFVPVAGAVLAWLPKPTRIPPGNPEPVSPEATASASAPARWLRTARGGRAVVILAFLFGWAAVWLTFDRRQKLLAEIDYHTGCEQYETVLAAARQVTVLDHPAKVRLLLALYHTGRLAEALFSLHDMVEDAPAEDLGDDYRAQSQALFELGLINDAEHAAHEALELQGNRPDLLRLLARINLLKDRPEAAQIFLNVLSRIPFQGQRANDAWPAVNPQMPPTERALLAQMRARVLTKDVLHDGLPVGRLLDVLLVANPTNQMAFEYLMAYYLLDLELPKAVEHLQLLDNFNYARIPKPYEEALLLFQQVGGVQVELKGRTIRPETAERFRRFGEAVAQWRGSARGQGVLAAQFGDTYWYYWYVVGTRRRTAEGHASGP